MDLSFYPLRFQFRAVDPIVFPPGLAANTLRGGFGLMLRQRSPKELYERIFEPSQAGPSGLKNPPRPFVFRAMHLGGRRFEPGVTFDFNMNLFDTRAESVAAVRDAFEALGAAGFGLGRGRAQLQTFEAPLTTVSLKPNESPVSELRIEIVTPLELKAAGEISTTLEFAGLFARVRDRISTLRALYGPGPLDVNFRELGLRASQIRTTAADLSPGSAGRRRSSRTGQTYAVSGITGSVEYSGDLSDFVPYLRAAQFCGVGRQCVWGKGHILVIDCK